MTFNIDIQYYAWRSDGDWVAAVTIFVAAALAGYVPARRAARIDPMVSLRQD